MMRMTETAVLATAMIMGAIDAAAQPASRPALTISGGMAGTTDRRMTGPAAQAAIGAELPLTSNWSVRLEAGGRLPSSTHAVAHAQYFIENPAAPGDPRASFPVESTTEIDKQTLADAAVLFRRAWRRGRTETALLFGPDFSVVRYRSVTSIPRSLTDPSDADVFRHENTRVVMVLDLGLDIGWRVSERWSVFAFGIAGLQPPLEEHRTWQPRAGVLIRRAMDP